VTALESLTTPHPAKLSVEDFIVLDRAGAFQSYAKTELIDGTIYVVNAQYSAHMKAKVRLLRRLADACDMLGIGMEAWSEGAVAIGPSSMPEPDIFIATAIPEDGPVPSENLVLVVEISDTTQVFDLGKKAKLYARCGIAEYWVVDLKAKLIHRKWSPSSSGYGETSEVRLGERIEAATIAGLAVETEGL
jgi:Uma2 family endonuclease